MAVRRRLQADRNPALRVLDRIRDQFAGDKSERDGRDRRNLNFGSLNGQRSLRKLARRHVSEIVAKLFEVSLELDAFDVVQSVEMPMDAPERCDTVGGDGQLRRRFVVFGAAALHREQACDQLQSVQQTMFGLLAQDVLLLDQFVLLAQQFAFTEDGFSQLGFRLPMPFQFLLIHCDRGAHRDGAIVRPLKLNRRFRRVSALDSSRRIGSTHGQSPPL